MKKAIVGITAALILLAWACPALAGGDRELALAIYKNFQAGQALPLASKAMPGLTLAQAYGVQAALMSVFRSNQDQVAGFKAGLTSKAVQQRFGAKGPAFGVLMASMRRYGVVNRKSYYRLMVEVEIGYLLGKPISSPVTHRTVRQYVVGIAPAVELPDLAFADLKAITLPDIVAANVTCRGFILGKTVRSGQVDPNAVEGQLWRDGKALGPAVNGKAALGSQWEALAWTVNQALALYGPLAEGSVIITGSLGPMFPGKPGSYRAVFSGGLGEVAFEVK
ncbi:MAG: fumarylacetoacetate hydrolase family protein [Proteobacteria bacterium]|nr:fumarylacetoacetate hydrolase family protein [Pseudomonadota bacterium]MBU4277718.1 fumarylacetoacetate hydrolase family protein [Pseudomonadota bacterium]MBU4385124.1 fumarylacetoacetate hydrolase family protein [Pseudomonadota bacterium]MBU4604182.1 fumarylacetoacetate hydrolase family protein [Pseudomonadota bacterium]MCG2764731.1 fumarylacetoacetate hydrolase family protein [Desulfarculaceae bacterium]